MATAPVSPPSLCRPEEDPCLLLEVTLHAVEEILHRQRRKPLRRCWMDLPYGEEEITLLEEELLPALKRFVARIADVDDWILVETELMKRCWLEDARLQITRLRPVLR